MQQESWFMLKRYSEFPHLRLLDSFSKPRIEYSPTCHLSLCGVRSSQGVSSAKTVGSHNCSLEFRATSCMEPSKRIMLVWRNITLRGIQTNFCKFLFQDASPRHAGRSQRTRSVGLMSDRCLIPNDWVVGSRVVRQNGIVIFSYTFVILDWETAFLLHDTRRATFVYVCYILVTCANSAHGNLVNERRRNLSRVSNIQYTC